MGGTPAWGSAGADPADRVADRLDVDSALAQLTPDFRVAVVLRDLSGLGYDEIAAVLEVPVGTVRSRISRGRAALAGLLADRDGNPTGPAGVEPGGGREEPSASD
jgi:DNA-directed RNA polymerase specialized sigma24 family protein